MGAAARGWQVALNYREDRTAVAATLAEVGAQGVDALAIQTDITDEAQVIALFDQTIAHFGRLDGFVNNAGIVDASQPLAAMSAERLRRMFDVNVYGAFLGAREAARRLPRGGAIVNVSSIAARPRLTQ